MIGLLGLSNNIHFFPGHILNVLQTHKEMIGDMLCWSQKLLTWQLIGSPKYCLATPMAELPSIRATETL